MSRSNRADRSGERALELARVAMRESNRSIRARRIDAPFSEDAVPLTHLQSLARPERAPQLSISATAKNLIVSLVDDASNVVVKVNGLDVIQASHLTSVPELVVAKMVGKVVADRALAAGVTAVVFKHRPKPQNKRLLALAEAARENGLQIE